MKKTLEFLKNNILIIKWTIWYILAIWLILKYIFGFEMFSYNYWWKFSHATIHGFNGFVFCALIYAAIPLYIVTTIITYRNKEYVIKIPVLDKLFGFISKIFKKPEPQPEPESEPEPEPEQNKKHEYPDDLPPELRVPFMRAKQHLSLNGAVSVYNKTAAESEKKNISQAPEQNKIPIPTDFDISDTLNDLNDSVPTFTDIDFDAPIATEKEPENNTTKYLKNKNIEYETYRDYVATAKYLIYEHNDEDFWVMDDDTWFASGQQKDSPTKELIEIAKQNELQPVIYLESQNIMNIEETIQHFESMGIHVIKDLDELD